MTTPTPTTQPDQITAAEIRELFAELRAEIATIDAKLEAMRAGLQTAATPPASTFGEMDITAIVKSIDKKDKINFLAIGAPYNTFGVRVWDEVLPALGIDPESLKFGNNPITPGIRARVLLGETTNQKTGKVGIGPHKVTGKA